MAECSDSVLALNILARPEARPVLRELLKLLREAGSIRMVDRDGNYRLILDRNGNPPAEDAGESSPGRESPPDSESPHHRESDGENSRREGTLVLWHPHACYGPYALISVLGDGQKLSAKQVDLSPALRAELERMSAQWTGVADRVVCQLPVTFRRGLGRKASAVELKSVAGVETEDNFPERQEW